MTQVSDALTTITKLINSPPGQLAAGGVLAGIVWKFFERVEAVLTDQTKLEISRWLRVKNVETGIVAAEAVNWPVTFAKVFDRVFGTKHLSWKCFRRSCAVTVVVLLISKLAIDSHAGFGNIADSEVNLEGQHPGLSALVKYILGQLPLSPLQWPETFFLIICRS